MLSYSERKTFARHGAANIEAKIGESLAQVEAEEKAAMEVAIAAYKSRNAPVEFTPEQLAAATHIRTELGWHKVVRVSAKSVTVETGHSWTDRYPVGKILEVRTIA